MALYFGLVEVLVSGLVEVLASGLAVVPVSGPAGVLASGPAGDQSSGFVEGLVSDLAAAQLLSGSGVESASAAVR